MANENTQQDNSINPSDISVSLINGQYVVSSEKMTDDTIEYTTLIKPKQGEVSAIEVTPASNYFFDAKTANIEALVHDGDDVTISFDDGSALTLIGFGQSEADAAPTSLTFSETISADYIQSLLFTSTILEDDDSTDVANIQPAAGNDPSAADVAAIEPAAGDDAAGGSQNSGFTFNDPDAANINGLAATGPLAETALQYGVEFLSPDLFPQDAEPDTNPEVP